MLKKSSMFWNKLYDQVITKIPKRWRIAFTVVLCIGFLVGAYAYKEYNYQRDYHAQAETIDHHYYDDVRYREGFLSVHWVRLPKPVECAFRESWEMNKVRRGWTEVHSWYYQTGAVPDYQRKGGSVSKEANFWGDDVWIGLLSPGEHEIRIKYQYIECFNWGINSFEPDQTIVFNVKLMIDEEGNSVLIGTSIE